MPKNQQFNGPVEQVSAEAIHNHHHWNEPEPPDDPAKSIQCPQCGKLTWRFTQHCIHCRLDLERWGGAQRWRRIVQLLTKLGWPAGLMD